MKRNAWKAARGSAGFTLVELVVVIAILGILAGVGTVGYSGYIQRANEAVDETTYNDIIYAGAIGSYANPNAEGGSVHVSKDAAAYVTSDSGDEAIVKEWLSNAFGSDWADTLKYKTDLYANNRGIIAIPQEKIPLTEEQQQLADKFKDSNYSGNESELLDTVDNLAEALKNNANNLNALKTLDPAAYNSLMQAMVEQGLATQLPDGTYEVVEGKENDFANASVLYLASQYENADGSYDAAKAQEALIQALASGASNETLMNSLKEAGNGNTLAGAALAYALTLGYANSDNIDPETAASIKEQAGNVQGVGSMLNYFQSINDEGFQEYLNSSEAQQDVDGYLGAMGLIGSFGDKVDITLDNAYGNDSVLALIQGVLNGK